jgi:uncharacterized protein YbbK (DUF523 family)/uncharacterized protein YbgA (DUF1722 family)
MDSQSESIIHVGISSCLLGEKVRWNGEHKKDFYIDEILGHYFEWVPVCPEMEVGMGVPREPVYLTGSKENPRLVGKQTKTDWTGKMRSYSRVRINELQSLNLCGFIFKKKSPSCGLKGIPIYPNKGPRAIGRGLFADVFIKRYPNLPMEDEGRLRDPRNRENFIVRIFSYQRLQQLMNSEFSRGRLFDFHTHHKLLLLAHSRKQCAALDHLVAQAKQLSPTQLRQQYSALFMQALSTRTTAKKNVDVLQYMLRYLKKLLGKDDRQDILKSISDYHHSLVPLVVPLTLIKHHVRKFRIEILMDQVYLNPHPTELLLRNHV